MLQILFAIFELFTVIWKQEHWPYPFQPSDVFHKSLDMQCKTNGWFLYKMQHPTKMGWIGWTICSHNLHAIFYQKIIQNISKLFSTFASRNVEAYGYEDLLRAFLIIFQGITKWWEKNLDQCFFGTTNNF